jgi:uncharacterized membrane protein
MPTAWAAVGKTPPEPPDRTAEPLAAREGVRVGDGGGVFTRVALREDMARGRKRYAYTDTAQQIVGGFVLAGPFVVTEEVWLLASRMQWYHATVTVLMVAIIGYGALYKADDGRDPDREAEVAGVPVRFVSLMIVSFGSVFVLSLALTAPVTFATQLELGTEMAVVVPLTAKAASVGAIFSVVGAATADSLL